MSKLEQLQAMSHEELLAFALKQGKSTNGGYKASAKTGSLSRYGLGRFPVSLYVTQWNQIIADVESGVLQDAIEKGLADGSLKAGKDGE